MRAPLVISLGIVAVAGLAGAFALGVFNPRETAGPADAAAPAVAQPAEAEPPAPAPAPAPTAPRPVASTAAPLPPLPTTATLRIDSDVPGADVFIDNAFVGKAPAIVENVAPGQHKISVSAPGHETVAEFRDIEAGQDALTISLRTIRLDRRVAVTHRHRFGSCEGALVATPAGLRYRTSNAEDAFTVPLTRIGELEADYLERNLKVGIAGRTWNFTVPDGKADDLYAFYQDVAKVRQRLIEEGAGDV